MTSSTQPSGPSTCTLCRHDALEPQFVAETASFLLLAASEPLAEGHALLVPRAHVSCMAALPESADAELLGLKERALQMLEEAWGQVAVLEQGSLEDEAAHAQLHLVPGAPDLTADTDGPREVAKIDTPEELRTHARRWRWYLYWEQGGARSVANDTHGAGRRLRAWLEGIRNSTTKPSQPGRAAARSLRGLWQRRMVAAGQPIEVVTCLLRRGDRLCLLRRSPLLDSAPGKWHSVSGYLPEGVDPGEHALREIEQEVGLRRDQVSLVRTVPAVTFGSRSWGYMWRIHPFLFDMVEGEPRLNWEHTDLRWVRPEEIAQYDCIGSLPELVRLLTQVGG